MKTSLLLLWIGCILLSACENSSLKWNLPKLARVETYEPEKISATSVQCTGNVIAEGGLAVLDKGFCYDTASMPTIQKNKIEDGNGEGIFTVRINGLKPNTNYYFRAYGINRTGVSYGNEISYKTGNLLVLSTTAVSAITTSSAITGGSINSDDSSGILERGICYDITANPTVANTKIAAGKGNGSFTVTLNGLHQATTYYVRAYASDSSGITYGNVISFTTTTIILPSVSTVAATNVTLHSAVAGGNVSSDGGSEVSSRGVCYSTKTNPTTSDNKVSSGTGTGNFSVSLTGLAPGTVYYIRAYATNVAGTSYGSELNFTTTAVQPPTVKTSPASALATTSAVSGGNVTDDGGSPVTERGVCYSLSSDPTLSDQKISAGLGTGIYSVNLTGLTPKTTYYLRAYAMNSAGTSYGDQITLITASVSLPVVTTASPSSVTENSAISGGNITDDGGGTLTERGLCFNTAPSPTISDHKIASGNTPGDFSVELTGLSSGTTYYVRAYAINSAGIAYGNEFYFQTSTRIKIGNMYEGGIIFYVDGTGKHGLIAAPSDQSSASPWGCSGKSISGSEAIIIGSGSANTTAIVTNCSDPATAAKVCYGFILNGNANWYLPSKDELNLMYTNLKMNGTGGFSNSDYWSSSQETDKNAWLQNFSSGKPTAKNKNSSLAVRAIRSF